MKKNIIRLLFLVSIFGCSKQKDTNESQTAIDKNSIVIDSASASIDYAPMMDESVAKERNYDAMPLQPPPKEIQPNILNVSKPKKIIYSANIRFRVQDLNQSESNLKNMVQKLGGYITHSSENRAGGNLNTEMIIRIPVAKFDEFINGSEKESIFTDAKNIGTEDVTEEFFDNELRLKSKKEAFEKYLSLLKQAKNVTEVMAVEEQLRQIREEIESKEGRQKYLNNQVAFSTVTLDMYQIIPSENAPDLPISTKIWEKFTAGNRSLLSYFIGIFYLLPFILVVSFIIGAIWWWRKRK